ncbi:hypothetical protein [Streptomyces yerevanensis]|uniref:hypothetical protein n=1 Tax=Streptomyces yerevanensis TaxID=66378 RepID=UPI000526B234|nr:hypothetical protein [Streptomyces yerevanensis]
MRIRTATAIAVLLLAPLTACSSSDSDSDDTKADPSACKAAMTKQMKDAIENGATSDKRPAECVGVDDKTVQQYVGEITKDQLGAAVDEELDKLESPQP